MSGSAAKIIVIFNADGNKDSGANDIGFRHLQIKITDGGLFQGFTAEHEYYLRAPTASKATPWPVFDPASGNVKMCLNCPGYNSGRIVVASLRPGQCLGSVEQALYVGDGNLSPSMALIQGAPQLCYAWDSNSETWMGSRSSNFDTSGDWRNKSIANSATRAGPVILKVGDRWIYTFHVAAAGSGQAIWAFVMDPDSLKGWWNSETQTTYNWSAWSATPTSTTGTYTGRPAIVLSGSAPLDRKFNYFVINSKQELRYFSSPLSANGLPQTKAATTAPYVSLDMVVQNEMLVGNGVGGPVSACVWNDTLFVFAQTNLSNNKGKIACWWKPVSSGSWQSTAIGTDLFASTQVRYGGTGCVIVPADF